MNQEPPVRPDENATADSATAPIFTNPYAKNGDCKTTVQISMADRAYLKGLGGPNDTIQTFVGILVNKAINELKLAGIVDYEQSAKFRNAIAGCHVQLFGGNGIAGITANHDLPRGTPPPSGPETNRPDDRSGTTGMARESTGNPAQPANPSGAPKSSGTVRSKRKGKE